MSFHIRNRKSLSSGIAALLIVVGLCAGLAQAQPAPPPAMPPVSVPTAVQCYELAATKGQFPRTPTELCVEQPSHGAYVLTIRQGLPMNRVTLVQYSASLLLRARCIDCNKDIFGSAMDSAEGNLLKIKFNGVVNVKASSETGTVTVAGAKFYYRKATTP
ncbi:MAG: hypothetical protein IPL79_09160 [Myxococcales bacterium]|nr:hypothetical protein [Myxococcales bacterium]